ncbi:MAG TPA: DinB family protein [Vicinamibacterales bacterium]|nr:DinB family protein [Vicinamibacterales bacterium]
MSITAGLPELLSYSDHERAKWRAWVEADPSRLALPFQPGARFATVGSIFDHIFLIERRHLSRMEGATPPDSTGVAAGDVQGLVEYGDLVRADFRRFVTDLDDASASKHFTFTIPTGPMTMSRRKLATNVVLHEVRHLAQVAHAARAAGVESPGDHDLLFCPTYD